MPLLVADGKDFVETGGESVATETDSLATDRALLCGEEIGLEGFVNESNYNANQMDDRWVRMAWYDSIWEGSDDRPWPGVPAVRPGEPEAGSRSG